MAVAIRNAAEAVAVSRERARNQSLLLLRLGLISHIPRRRRMFRYARLTTQVPAQDSLVAPARWTRPVDTCAIGAEAIILLLRVASLNLPNTLDAMEAALVAPQAKEAKVAGGEN